MSKKAKPFTTAFNPRIDLLPGGIQIVADVVPFVESCAIGIWIKAGTRDEPKGRAGVAHFVEHTSFRRTRSRTSRQIAREFENVGAYANAYTTKEETCYYVRTLSEYIPTVIRTLIDIVLWPTFEVSDVEKERGIIAEEIRAYEDEVEEFIFDESELQLFGQHPLGLPIVGTSQSINSITASDVKEFHHKHYHTGSIVVTVSGNVDVDEFIVLTTEFLSSANRGRKSMRRSTPPILTPSELIIRKPIQQAHLLWHTRTNGFSSRDRFALMLLNVILGDGMTSRINQRFRETKGIAYNVYSHLQLFFDVGMFGVYAGVDEKKVDRSRLIIEHEIDVLGKSGVRPTELRRAKEQVRAAKIMSLESLSSRMTMLGKGMLDAGDPEDPFDTIQQLESVSVDEINTIASLVCNPADWSRCLVLPSKT